MRKIITLMLLLLSFVLVGCRLKVEINNEVLYDYFINTKELYTESSSGHIKLTIVDADETSVLEFIYNNNDQTIESMKLVLNEAETLTEAYVKNGNAYFNVNGEKTYTTIDSVEGEELLAGYWFEELTETVYKILNKSIFNSISITEHNGKTVQLVWNPENYVFINEDFTNEEYLEAEQHFYDVKDNMKSIDLVVIYDDIYITSLDSKWINNDNQESTIRIEFLGTATQEIAYPSDLNSYIAR